MVKLAELLSSKNTKSKVIYVPGQTDAADNFNKHQSAGKTVNLHKDFYELAEGLLMVGIGGSVPSYHQAFPEH